jgi:2-hydroxychromene-2-carboxylate isomerase
LSRLALGENRPEGRRIGAMNANPLRFFFDYVSPYAYLAWTQLPGLAARHGRALELVPVLFAGVLNALGTTGPAEVPHKRFYIYKHTWRPAAHPFNPLLALRVTAAVEDAQARQRLASALYAAVWAGDGELLAPERVGAVVASVGLDARALLAAAQTPAVKEQVRRNTEELLALEGFGVPSLLADGELFFGLDSLGHLERFLRGEDPLHGEDLERLRNLPVAASRTGSRSQ